MCDVCRQYPCHSRCPNHEYDSIGNCDKCDEELYEGYEIWTDDNGYKFCSEDCAKEFYGIKVMN